jgi:phosphatidylglycerophosphate synthase
VVTVRNGLAESLVGLVVLLAALDVGVGIGAEAWAAGLVCAAVLSSAVARGASRAGVDLGPADRVTLARATLSCAVAALVADSFLGQAPAVPLLVALAGTALFLDAVDGRVARRSGTTSGFGGRFDGEADAFLLLVLSVYVAQSAGLWVLAIGAARYAFAAAGWVLPWLREPLPPRYWRKVVTATQGLVLTAAVAGIAHPTGTRLALAVALVLLTESFGRDVWWLWRHRLADVVPATAVVLRSRPR